MIYEAGQKARSAGRYRCSGTGKSRCMRAIVVGEDAVLPFCDACSDRRSVWFLVERFPRVEIRRPPRAPDEDAIAGRQRRAPEV